MVKFEMEKEEQKLIAHLIAVAETYAKAKGLALSTVSRRIHGNDWFLRRFADGSASVTIRKYFEMLRAFRANWPEGIKWPKKP